MQNPQPAPAIFDKHALVYEEKYMDVSMYWESLDFFCNKVHREGAEILDIACGPGNVARYLLDKRPDFRLTGTDLAPNMLDLARKNAPEAEFLLLDARDTGSLGRKFDAVVCAFVAPYLSKPEVMALIDTAASTLRDQGVLYLSTMEDDHDKSLLQTNRFGDQLMMYYHEADYLCAAMEQKGLSCAYLQRLPAVDGVSVDLVVVGLKAPPCSIIR